MNGFNEESVFIVNDSFDKTQKSENLYNNEISRISKVVTET